MSQKGAFVAGIQKSYSTSLSSIHLGAGLLDGKIIGDVCMDIPLGMMNRCGLVAGATGSGKTQTVQVLAELCHTLPEADDRYKPKLVFFLGEAHLLLKDASKAFMEQTEKVVRLIRTKGRGVFFRIQIVQYITGSILSKLENRVQHALRAFTLKDAEGLKQTVKTYTWLAFYEKKPILTTLGSGRLSLRYSSIKTFPPE